MSSAFYGVLVLLILSVICNILCAIRSVSFYGKIYDIDVMNHILKPYTI